jgi:hypothetical protein
LVALERVVAVEAVEQMVMPPLLVLFHRLVVEVVLDESKVVLAVVLVVALRWAVGHTAELLGKVTTAVLDHGT